MSVTLADVYHLLNIPLNGAILLSSFTDSPKGSFNCTTNASRLSYSFFITHGMGSSDEVSFQEECSLYLY